ncbi:MAG: histone deacetylase [Rubripirellula sp.]
MDKYRLLRHHVVNSENHRRDVLLVPSPATDEQLLTCHTAEYVQSVVNGTLTSAQIRRIGFPWSDKMVQRSRRSTGATIQASRSALQEGVAVNLAGGTHHAMSDAGEGYCVFNDAAVAIRTLQSEQLIKKACVIDLDVHQGNGTAQILHGDLSAFTLSIHGVKNFPIRKFPSDLDVALVDETGDQAYLCELDKALETLLSQASFDLAIYLAGADPFLDDRLGRLSLTKQGLRLRDKRVLEWCRNHGIPVAVAMAGGYARKISDIVDIHAATVREASESCQLQGT